MSPEIEISVVMSVRCDPEGAVTAAQSVLQQESCHLELVVVVDGADNETNEALAGIAVSDVRLRVYPRPAQGLTRSLIFGCAQATGPIIARQDAGDRSAPGRIRTQQAALEVNPKAVLVSCATVCYGPAGETLYEQRGASRVGTVHPILSDRAPLRVEAGPTSHGSAMFRRSAFDAAGGYREEFALGQDWDLWLRLGLLGGYVEVDEVLYERTLDPTSLSFLFPDLQRQFGQLSLEATRRRAANESESGVLAAAARLSVRAEALRPLRREAGRYRGLYHVGEALRRREDPRALGYLRQANRLRPTGLRAWIRRVQAELQFRDREPISGAGAGAAGERT